MNKPSGQTAYSVFPVSNYKFGTKAVRQERGNNTEERINRIRAK
jgi:hypothetical protein